MNLEFSFARWGRLVVHRLTDDLKPLGLALGVVTGLQVLAVLLSRESRFLADGSAWTAFTVLASLFCAASAFRPMHEGRSATDWLLWPASSFEKWAAAAFEVLVAVPVGLIVVSIAGSALLWALSLVVVGHGSNLWFPRFFGHDGALAETLVMLAVFFAGSSAFRKNSLWKTGLLLVTLGMVVALVTFTWVRLVSGDSWSNWEGGMHLQLGGMPITGFTEVLVNAWFYGLVPLFCLGFSFAKVVEKEARDEVQ